MSEINNLEMYDEIEPIDVDASLSDSPAPPFEFDPKTRKKIAYRTQLKLVPDASSKITEDFRRAFPIGCANGFSVNQKDGSVKHHVWVAVDHVITDDAPGAKGRTKREYVNTMVGRDSAGNPTLSKVDDMLKALGLDGTRLATMSNLAKAQELVRLLTPEPEVKMNLRWILETADATFNAEKGKDERKQCLRGQAKFGKTNEQGVTVFKPKDAAPPEAEQNCGKGAKYKVPEGTPCKTTWEVTCYYPLKQAA